MLMKVKNITILQPQTFEQYWKSTNIELTQDKE